MTKPDELFRRMERMRRATLKDTGLRSGMEMTAVQPVYVPQNIRDGSYRQLMKSHDRMGTRHLQ